MTVKEYFELPSIDTLFGALYNQRTLENIQVDFESVLGNDTAGIQLYFLSKFKNRVVSSFVETTVEQYFNDRYTGYPIVCRRLLIKYKDKWNKLISLLNTKYDPLKPFDITLIETSGDTLDTEKDRTTYNDNEKTYGFNSNSAVPTDDSSGTTNREYKRTIDKNRDYTRKGNIGNTSFQDLVKQEREVANYQISEIIYNDIADFICRGKYI